MIKIEKLDDVSSDFWMLCIAAIFVVANIAFCINIATGKIDKASSAFWLLCVAAIYIGTVIVLCFKIAN